jgi:hypothetical protein
MYLQGFPAGKRLMFLSGKVVVGHVKGAMEPLILTRPKKSRERKSILAGFSKPASK